MALYHFCDQCLVDRLISWVMHVRKASQFCLVVPITSLHISRPFLSIYFLDGPMICLSVNQTFDSFHVRHQICHL